MDIFWNCIIRSCAIIACVTVYSTGQKKPNRERCAERVLKAFCFAFPKRSPSVPLAFQFKMERKRTRSANYLQERVPSDTFVHSLECPKRH